jgi:hypothetical protein
MSALVPPLGRAPASPFRRFGSRCRPMPGKSSPCPCAATIKMSVCFLPRRKP